MRGLCVLYKLLTIFLLIAFTTSCSTVSDDYLGGKVESATQLNTGDVIRVVTAEYEDFRFRVTEITEVAIHGEKVSIPFEIIRTLEIISLIKVRMRTQQWSPLQFYL